LKNIQRRYVGVFGEGESSNMEHKKAEYKDKGESMARHEKKQLAE
jgi:hypothetical protein